MWGETEAVCNGLTVKERCWGNKTKKRIKPQHTGKVLEWLIPLGVDLNKT